jgi:tetratricopeptide (TPR) repeat protein
MLIRRLGLGLAILLWAATAMATPAESARDMATAGKAAFDRGELETALEKFGYTFLFATSPNAAINVATTLERLRRPHEAAVAFDRSAQLLGTNDPERQASIRKQAESNRARAGEKTATTLVDEARRANAAGQYAFEHKDYDVAIAQFLRAYLLVPHPTLVFNIGVALEWLGQYRLAAQVFDRFLELAPEPKTDDQRRERTRTQARADALRYKRDVTEPEEVNPGTLLQTASPGKPEARQDPERINLIVHGRHDGEDKEKRCFAAVKRAGIWLEPDARVTAVLTLERENRLRIVERDLGILSEVILPRSGMEQLCVTAAQAAVRIMESQAPK